MTKKEEKTKKTTTTKETTKNNKKTETKKNKVSTKKTEAKKTTKTTKKPFFKDVKAELKKVRWPLKKEMITYSIATLVFMLILGLFFVATDLIIAGIRMVFI